MAREHSPTPHRNRRVGDVPSDRLREHSMLTNVTDFPPG
eukprot:CAMPEP_0173382386 /NCGR_PEP_ID=MMETSP1356-20130122/4896_1 /TAXON_ID=77927 ORGANISM="Hemiselmis virescens, Strain PCC157" /NCGR_SAMPLE_ID=MMETSP1356 /ASSEMBLY_ACC=CAM_ASM_000847 /LENGTH=38 /DNA_ID= /DNA_START= /DNA_END= /DNA_ORIENTATION=